MKLSKALEALVEKAAAKVDLLVDRAKLDFAVSLEAQRRAAGLSYRALADALKTSPAYVSKVFRGDGNLTIETMVKLAHAAGGRVEVRVVGIESATKSDWGAALFARRQNNVVPIQVASTYLEANSCANQDHRLEDLPRAA